MTSRIEGTALADSYGRCITYLRISIVDRCNLRCIYCMPKGHIRKLRREELLKLEEIVEVARVAALLGIRKYRITGGEPLLRRGAVKIIRELVDIGAENQQVVLTTNGQRLSEYADILKEVGLARVNVSLDSLDPLVYRRVTGGGKIQPVLQGISRANEAGLPVRINTVLTRFPSRRDLERWLEFAAKRHLELRFIERMEFDSSADFVETEKLVAAFGALCKMSPAARENDSPHVRRFKCGDVTLGFISPRSGPFCRDCNRLRLTSTGQLKPCLAAPAQVDVMQVMRRPHRDTDIQHLFRRAARIKPREGPWTVPGRMWQVGG